MSDGADRIYLSKSVSNIKYLIQIGEEENLHLFEGSVMRNANAEATNCFEIAGIIGT